MIQDDDIVIERRQYFDLHWRDKLIRLATDTIDKLLIGRADAEIQLRHSSFESFLSDVYINAVLCDPDAGVGLVRHPYHMSKKISMPISHNSESIARQFVDEIRSNYITLDNIKNILIF